MRASGSPASRGRRGRKTDRLGPTGGCSPPATGSAGPARLTHVLAADDPTNEIDAAWGVTELLRRLLAAPTAHDARHRLFRVHDAVLVADMPETTRLAETVQTWWPAVE